MAFREWGCRQAPSWAVVWSRESHGALCRALRQATVDVPLEHMSVCGQRPQGPPTPTRKPYCYHSLDTHLERVVLQHVQCSMDGRVHGLTRTRAEKQSSQHKTRLRENPRTVPATQLAGPGTKDKCRAPC